MSRGSSTPPPEGLADALHSTSIHLLRKLRRVDEESGLGAPQLSALSVLVFAGPQSLGDLARVEQVRPASMSVLVKRLELDGLVRRRVDAQDRRIVRVEATARGVRRMQRGKGRRVKELAKRLEGLNASDLRAVERAVAALRRVIEGWE